MSHGRLTPKQRRFVDEYLVDLNATQAATRRYGTAHAASARAISASTATAPAPRLPPARPLSNARRPPRCRRDDRLTRSRISPVAILFATATRSADLRRPVAAPDGGRAYRAGTQTQRSGQWSARAVRNVLLRLESPRSVSC
jgi:hypothetical protein